MTIRFAFPTFMAAAVLVMTGTAPTPKPVRKPDLREPRHQSRPL